MTSGLLSSGLRKIKVPSCLGDGRKTVNTNSPHCGGLNPRPAGPLGVRVTWLLRAGVLVLQTIRDRLGERIRGFLLPPRTTSTPHQPVERSRGEQPRVHHPPNRLRAQAPQRPRGTLAMGPWRASRFRSCSGGLVAAGTGLLPSRSLMCFKRNLLSDPKVRRIPITPTAARCSRPDRKPGSSAVTCQRPLEAPGNAGSFCTCDIFEDSRPTTSSLPVGTASDVFFKPSH